MLMVGGSVIALALLLPRNIYWLTHFAGPLFARPGCGGVYEHLSQSMTESGAFGGWWPVSWSMSHECDVTGGSGHMAGAGGPDSDWRHQQLRCDTLISTRAM